MKRLPAILAALSITACLGLGILAVGANALFNKNSVTVAQASAGATDSANQQQLQERVAQYQQRERQYQEQLNQARQQLQAAAQQVQQYQNLLLELQQQGVIAINRDGQIFIPGRFR